MKKRIFSLLLAVVMLIGMFPVYPFASAASNSAATIYCDGKQVSNVTLPYGDAVHLEAKQSAAGSLQWQIQVNSNLWVDISNADSHSLRVSYGMVASLLKGNSAQMRCAVKNGSEVQYSEPVTVTVDYTEPETSEPVQEPVDVQVQVQETPVQQETVDETADEKAALAKAQENLTAAENAVKEAEAALANEQQLAESAATAVADAEAAKAAADVKAAEAKVALGSAYDEAIAAAKTAEENLAAAKTAADEAAAAVPAAKEKATAAAAALAEAEAAKAAADAKVAEAEAALNLEAQAAYDAAVAAAKTAEENLAAAQAAAAAVSEDETVAVNEDETAETTEAAADTAAALAEAEAAKAAADAKVAEAKAVLDPEAQAAYDAAVADAKTAEENLAAAKTAADEAAAAVTAAEEAVTNTAAALAEAETAKTAADAKVAEEKAALDPEAQAAYDAAVAAAKAAEEAVVTAKAEAELRQQAVADAQKNLEAANAAKADAEKAVADAEAALKDAQAAGSQVLKFAAVPRATAEGTSEAHSVTIEYLLDGKQISSSWVAEVSEKVPLQQTVPMPSVMGYVPTVEVNGLPSQITPVYEGGGDNGTLEALYVDYPAGSLSSDIKITVTYQPSTVTYWVRHYWQNVDNDEYTLYEEQKLTGLTASQVGDVHKTDDDSPEYAGVYNLSYERPIIAADGSTVVEIYYDRNYYLLSFDLGEDGYGVEPVYARYGTPISLESFPQRPGYTFRHWLYYDRTAPLPPTMPAENRTYVAEWEVDGLAKVSVVIWGENADDEEYSYVKTIEIQAKPESAVTFQSANMPSCNYTEHTHSAECDYNCGITDPHIHSVANNCYQLNCTIEPHNHSANGCGYDCGKEAHIHSVTCCTIEEHTHTTGCYENVGIAFNGSMSEWGVTGQNIDGYIGQSYNLGGTGTKYIYINGTWYRYTGSLDIGSTASPSCPKAEHDHSSGCVYCDLEEHAHTEECYDCNKVNNDHVHTLEECYDLTCQETQHIHGVDCDYACGKIEHKHSSSCYITDPGMDSNLWKLVKSDEVTVAPDGSTVMNVYYDRTTFTLHFRKANSSIDDYGTITKKWGENIEDEFAEVCNKAGYQAWSEKSDASNPWTNYLMIMPQEHRTYYSYTGSGNNIWTMTYYTETLAGGTYDVAFTVDLRRANYTTVSEEEFIGIKGFTVNRNRSSKVGDYTNGAVFYYNRNSYTLTFNNGAENINSATVKYEAPLSTYKDYVPELPTSLYEEGSRVFDGWYLNPECTGDEYKLEEHTMPAENLLLYAKWKLVTRNVFYYASEDDALQDPNPIDEPNMDVRYYFKDAVTVDHGKRLTEGQIPPNPQDDIYTFEGWFYRDENGNENAFNPALMPVTQDMQVYARWKSTVEVTYTIDYKVVQKGTDGKPMKDADGNWVWATEGSIANEITTGKAKAGTSRTFYPKTGNELVGTNSSGYFPIVPSHTITFDAVNPENNNYIFPYWLAEKVPYKVYYRIVNEDGSTSPAILNQDGSEYIKEADSYMAILTEDYVHVSGYFPDEFQKTLILTVKEDGTPNDEANVITFYYTSDPAYQVKHYVRNTNDTGWELEAQSIVDGELNKTYSAQPIEIPGYTFSYENTVKENESGMNPDGQALPAEVTVGTDPYSVSGNLTAAGLELNLFYVRDSYPYIIYYKEKTTGQDVLPAVTGEEVYGKWLTGYRDLASYGFDCVNTDAGITIQIDKLDAAGVPEKNILTYWYVRQTGKLKISKFVEVINTDNPDTQAPDQVFTFEVRNTGKGFPASTEFQNFKCTIYDTASDEQIEERTLSLSNSTLTVELKAGQYAIIEGLPTDLYRVNEIPVLGFASEFDTAQEVQVVTGDTPANVAVTNKYPVYTGDLMITKEVNQAYENDDLPVDGFPFELVLTPEQEAMFVDRPFKFTIFNQDGTVHETKTDTVAQTDATKSVKFTLFKDQYVIFEDLVVGQYTVTETMSEHYDVQYFIYGVDGAQMYNGKTNAIRENVEIVADEQVSVKFFNTYRRHRGDLKLTKTVVEEYENDIWTDSNFSFTLDGWKTPLAPGEYKIQVNNEENPRTITLDESGVFTVEGLVIHVEDDLGSLTQSAEILIKDLPVTNNGDGASHKVVETTTHFTRGEGDAAETYSYVTSTKSSVDEYSGNKGFVRLEGQEVPTVITFTNTFKRTTGNLKITKIVEQVSDKVKIDTEQPFTFEVVLKDGTLAGEFECQITDADNQQVEDSATKLTVSAGKLSVQLKHNQSVQIKGLPVGNYTVTELAVDGYDSSFNSFNDTLNTADPAVVETNKTTELICRNRYPVYLSDLIVHKMVVTPEEFREADQAPTDDVFTYRVTISEYSKFVILENGITATFYNANGQEQPPQTLYFTNGDNGQDLTFNLKNGEKVKLNLPSCKYVIEETGLIRGDSTVAVTDHYQMSYTVSNESGVAGNQYSLAPGAEVNVLFTNTWKRHTGSLTVSKTAENASGETFLFQITGPNGFSMTLPLQAGQSRTIYDLPLGDYTVTENTAWSWRYTSDNAYQTVTLTETEHSKTVAVTNTPGNDKWLNDVSVKSNTFNPATTPSS